MSEQASEMKQPEETPQEVVATEPKENKSGYIDFNKPLNDQADTVKHRVLEDHRKHAKLQQQFEKSKQKQRELEEQLLELQKPQEAAKPDAELALTDPEEYNRQHDTYLASKEKQYEWDTSQKMRQAQLQQEAEQERQERIGNFVQRGASVGLDVASLSAAAQIVTPQLQEGVQNFISDHEFGPQLLNQLASNPMEVQTLASMDPIQAGVKLNEMAKAFQPKVTTGAPPPDDPIQGHMVLLQERGPKGASFE